MNINNKQHQLKCLVKITNNSGPRNVIMYMLRLTICKLSFQIPYLVKVNGYILLIVPYFYKMTRQLWLPICFLGDTVLKGSFLRRKDLFLKEL